jgi:hypothetical protein
MGRLWGIKLRLVVLYDSLDRMHLWGANLPSDVAVSCDIHNCRDRAKCSCCTRGIRKTFKSTVDPHFIGKIGALWRRNVVVLDYGQITTMFPKSRPLSQIRPSSLLVFALPANSTAQVRGVENECHVHGQCEKAKCSTDDSYGLLCGRCRSVAKEH